MEYRDYYATLGVPRGASQAEIRKAFRKLAREHHPDVNAGDPAAERRFKEVSEANEVLSDPQKRKLYDQLGADWERYQRAGAGGAAGGPFAGFGAGGQGGIRFEYRGDPEDLAGFSDFFRTFFGGGMGAGAARRGRPGASAGLDLDALLQEMGAGGGAGGEGGSSRGGRASRGRDVTAETEVSLEEVAAGTRRLVALDGRRLEVSVPAGVEDGRRIRISGKGDSGGDLYLAVRVRPHPVFARNGADLTRELPITLAEALLGGEVRVPTIDGRTLLLRLPAGTQNGRLFRLSGQGLPRFRKEGRGDLLVRARVVLPTALDEEGQRLARALADHTAQPDPRADTPQKATGARPGVTPP